jgi:DUF971 family protein
MSGLTKDTPLPTEIKLHQTSRVMDIAFSDGASFSLPFEYLRVYSPSAEVRGHGVGQETLQVGKKEINIDALDPIGNYAVQPTFSDGHATGIFSWDYLYELGRDHAALWADYLQRLASAGASRDARVLGGATTTSLAGLGGSAPAKSGHACGRH